MNKERTYTDVEILTDAINTLGGLNIPIAQIENIGNPIARVRHNLITLCEAIKRNNAKNEPEIEVVPVEDGEADPECTVEEVNADE